MTIHGKAPTRVSSPGCHHNVLAGSEESVTGPKTVGTVLSLLDTPANGI